MLAGDSEPTIIPMRCMIRCRCRLRRSDVMRARRSGSSASLMAYTRVVSRAYFFAQSSQFIK